MKTEEQYESPVRSASMTVLSPEDQPDPLLSDVLEYRSEEEEEEEEEQEEEEEDADTHGPDEPPPPRKKPRKQQPEPRR